MGDTQSALDTAPASSQWAILAGTRFALAFVVFVGHMQLGGLPLGRLGRLAHFMGAAAAVYGFLIISGYSIAASLDRSSSGFYARRFWRIFPTYIFSLLLAVIASHFVVGKSVLPSGLPYTPVTISEVVVALFMLQTIAGPTISMDAQVWTLAIEWWNYMLAPLYKRATATVLIGLIVISMIINGLVSQARLGQLQHEAGGILVGALSWYWIVGFLYYRCRRTPLGYAILLIPFLIAYVKFPLLSPAAVFALAAVALCEEISLPRWSLKIFDWLGELSYPIYLIHWPVILFFSSFHFYHSWRVFLVVLITSVAALHIVDLPIRKWGSNLSKRASDAPAAKE